MFALLSTDLIPLLLLALLAGSSVLLVYACRRLEGGSTGRRA